MSINRFSPGFANCQTSGLLLLLLLLDFARKCNFVESVYCCKNLKTPSINFLQKVKADYLMKRQEIYSFLFFLQGPTLRCATVLQMAGVYWLSVPVFVSVFCAPSAFIAFGVHLQFLQKKNRTGRIEVMSDTRVNSICLKVCGKLVVCC